CCLLSLKMDCGALTLELALCPGRHNPLFVGRCLVLLCKLSRIYQMRPQPEILSVCNQGRATRFLPAESRRYDNNRNRMDRWVCHQHLYRQVLAVCNRDRAAWSPACHVAQDAEGQNRTSVRVLEHLPKRQ